MKLKFNQATIDKIQAQTTLNINEMIKSPALLSELGDVVIKDIKRIARTGKNPITGGKFIPLSKGWIKRRGQLAETNQTDPTYKQNRSNITFTGQLLNSMGKRINKNILQIMFEGIHRRYNRSISLLKRSGKPLKTPKQLTNEQLAQYVGELRPFFYVRETLLPQLKSVVIRYIRRKL